VAEADDLTLRVLDTLNEAQARWYVAREALVRGRGGLKALHELTGMSRPTILKGIRELRAGTRLPADRVRAAGAGRKRVEATDPGFARALERVMAENTAGDPMSLLRWTNKSTARIAEDLTRRGHAASAETVRRKLVEWGYSLQANRKSLEGSSPVDRDQQFRYINRLVKRFRRQGNPVLSVDTKKKERVGNFKNSGSTWRPRGAPSDVNIYDYPHLGEGPAIPYGTYDVGRNQGFVNVGTSHDTAEFAVESVRRWWRLIGRRHYATTTTAVLLCADGGGSNGVRNRAWKYHVQRLADHLRRDITVCHYPPGTSKWNKIEHRLFSFISMNWRGRPLISYETVINLIGATRTKSGLRVKAMLDEGTYELGIKIPDEEMDRLDLRPHRTLPAWNYTLVQRKK
jgi:hypothetical protein